MIKFRKIRYRNILSAGNMWIEVYLDRSPSTMITGMNGTGKSLFLDAITFALFGKPFRKINKPQLINTKTNRELMVELDFEIGEDTYQIRRGQKPEIFEVKKNDVLQNQPGDSRDYQKTLNQSILAMDYSAFTQIVAVGKAQHVSFMKLDAAKRRQFIETILSLVIFSKMTQLQNQRMNDHKEKLTELKSAINVAGEKVAIREKYISDLESEASNAEQRAKDENENQILQLEIEIDELVAERAKLELPERLNYDAYQSNWQEAYNLQVRFNSKLQDLETQIENLKSTTVCQTCEQEIPESTRVHKCSEIEIRTKDLSDKLLNIDKKVNLFAANMKVATQVEAEYTAIRQQITVVYSKIQERTKRIEDLKKESQVTHESFADKIREAKASLVKLRDVHEKLQNKRASLSVTSEYMGLVSDMLKDSGIKGMLIKRYIPIINHAINNNLSKLGFFGKFSLDEEFEETIQARGIDTMSYNNFSEGEKLRIDLAVLMAWREVAHLQSNVSTNLLIFDEVLDGSLDISGTEALSHVLSDLKKTNLFVITHSPEKVADKMRSHIRFEKADGYSRIANENT